MPSTARVNRVFNIARFNSIRNEMRQSDGKSSHYVMSRLWYGLIFSLVVFFLHLFCLPRLASAFIHSVPTLQVTLTDTLDFPLFRSLSLNDCSTNRLISISCIKSILCFNEMVLSFRFVLTSTTTSTLHHGWKYAQIICELLQFKIAECSLADRIIKFFP